jgi:hypothetical protein
MGLSWRATAAGYGVGPVRSGNPDDTEELLRLVPGTNPAALLGSVSQEREAIILPGLQVLRNLQLVGGPSERRPINSPE